MLDRLINVLNKIKSWKNLCVSQFEVLFLLKYFCVFILLCMYPSEMVLMYWFGEQDTFLMINVEKVD